MANLPLDATTLLGQLRYLCGDTNLTSPVFGDDALNSFLAINYQSLFLSAAMALDAMAAKVAANFQSVKIGDFETSDADGVKALQQQATRFRDLEYNTPAWAVVEENLSGFNELEIIRNWVLRTEM